MVQTLPLFIDGKTVPPRATRHLLLEAPATGEPYTQIPLCGNEDVDEAVRVAKGAFSAWRETPVVERARVLFRYRQILESETEAVATRGLPRPRQDPFGCPGRSAAGHRGGGIRLRHALADPGGDRGGSGARD